jgi:hypothetical protein
MVRYSEEQTAILTKLSIPVDELRTVIDDDYVNFEFDIDMGGLDELRTPEPTSREVFTWLSDRENFEGLDHGVDLENIAESTPQNRDRDPNDVDCRGCGEPHDPNDIDNGLCPDCGTECAVCGTYHLEGAELNDHDICNECSRTHAACSECGEVYEHEDLVGGEDDRCHECASHYLDCRECGDEFHESELNNDGVCEYCAEHAGVS